MPVKNYKYTIWGIFIGLFFIILVWIVGSYFSNHTLSISSFLVLHKIYPVFWVVDFLPIVLGLIAYKIEIEAYAIENKLDVNLNKETEKSKKVLQFRKQSNSG